MIAQNSTGRHNKDIALDSQKRFSTQFISEYVCVMTKKQVNSSYFITKNGGKKLHPYILT